MRREKKHAEDIMATVQQKLDEAQAQFDTAMAHKQELEDNATATQRKMDSANALIGALAGEELRWTQQSKDFDRTIQRLTGACFLFRGAASVTWQKCACLLGYHRMQQSKDLTMQGLTGAPGMRL